MTSRRPGSAWVAALVLLAPIVAAGQATDETTVEELVRARVETIRAGEGTRIGDATIAAVKVLPALYERRGFRLLWPSEAAADEVLRAIHGSERHGLDPADYHLAEIERRRAQPTEAAGRVDLDLLLTDATIRLAYHLRFGKVDPEALDPSWNFTSQLDARDPATALQQVIEDGNVSDALDRLAPQQPFYRNLMTALSEYRRIRDAGGWSPVPTGPTLKPEMQDARVPALRRRLAMTGDLPAGESAGAGDRYAPALVAAVKLFQERHGLPADGVVGATTVQALDVPVAQRIEQLRATLERCRWVMHDVPERFVLVNVAGFEVYLVERGARIWESRVVVGKPYTKTPIFRAEMTYVVVNPTWTVPASIVQKEVLPGIRRDPGYLARKGYVRIDGQIVQPAGPRNALGRIKLMFPNTHSVYLHDTPSKSFFNETTRTFSHGCVRVAKPFELAALALNDPAWSTEALLAAADKGKTRTISLARPIPVLILYWTAAVGRDGRTYFLPDVYGRDPAIVRGLNGAFRFRKRPLTSAPASAPSADPAG